MEKDVFEKELQLCQKLSKENGGKCNWGTCANCGVIPLLYKLHKGVLIENEGELENLRKELLSI